MGIEMRFDSSLNNIEDIFVSECGRGELRFASDHQIHDELIFSIFHNSLLDSVLANQSENMNRLGLTDSVGPRCCLKIALGVPIGIEMNYNSGSSERDAHPASAR